MWNDHRALATLSRQEQAAVAIKIVFETASKNCRPRCWQAVEKCSGECSARKKRAKNRSLRPVNEDFEPVSDAAMCRLNLFSTAC